jgi:predicted HicB family RNase H-like nuclease
MIENDIEYKGFIAHYHFDDDKACYIATVINSSDTIKSQGLSPQAVTTAFHNGVDVYLERCKNKGLVPQQYCSTLRLDS